MWLLGGNGGRGGGEELHVTRGEGMSGCILISIVLDIAGGLVCPFHAIAAPPLDHPVGKQGRTYLFKSLKAIITPEGILFHEPEMAVRRIGYLKVFTAHRPQSLFCVD